MRRMGIIAATENADNIIGEELPEGETTELVATVADESTEVQADGDEIGTAVSQVEEAVQDGEKLEDIAEVASEAAEEGEGLDEAGAEMAEIALEHIRNKLGFDRVTRIVPARESFGQTSTRKASTLLVVESAMDTLKQVWAAIKAQAARIWDMIRGFIAKLFNSLSGLGKLVDDLLARANKLPSGAKPKEAELSAGGLARAISVKGVADIASYSTIKSNTGALIVSTSSLAGHVREMSQAAQNLANSNLDSAALEKFKADDGKQIAAIISDLKGKLPDAAQSLSGEELPKHEAGGEAAHLGPFVGGAVLTASVHEGKLSLKLSSGKGKAAEKVKALDAEGVKRVLVDAKGMIKAMEGMKSSL